MNALLKRIMGSCLIVSIVLTGCGTHSKTKSVNQIKGAMGRYMEESVGLQEFINYETKDVAIWESEEGKLQALILSDTLTAYEEGADGKWKEVDMPLCNALNQMGDKLYELGDVIITPESKKVYIEGYKANPEGQRGDFYLAQFLDNTLKEMDISWENENKDLEVKIDEEGQILILDTTLSGIQLYDGQTGELKQVIGKGEDIRDFTVVGNQAFAIASPNVLNVYAIKDGQLLRSIEGVKVDVQSQIISADKEGSVYILTTEGVFKLPKDGNMFEKMIEGSLCSLGSASVFLKESWVCKGEIYAYLMANNPSSLVKYVYHEEVPAVPETQVTIFTLKECFKLREAVEIYKKKHPDAYIRYEGMLDKEDRFSGIATEAISILNTELLAGEGPDLFVLDGLPVETYMKKGVLADLTTFLDEKSKSEGLLDNLMKTYQIDEKVYTLPLGFNLVVGVGEKELTQEGISLEKLVQYKERYPDKKIIHSTLPGMRIREIGPWWVSRLFDKEGKVNTGELKALLQGLKRITPKDKGQYALVDYTYDSYGFRTPDFLLYEEGCVEIERVGSGNEFQVIAYINEHRGNSQITTKIDGEEDIAIPVELVGINSASKNQEAAMEIMSIALSKEAQSVGCLPVRKDSLEDRILHNNYSKVKPMYVVWQEDGTVKDQVQFEWGYEKEMRQFLDSCMKAKLMKPMDPQIYEIIRDESMEYFEETIDIDQTVNNISKKINLYLSEQN